MTRLALEPGQTLGILGGGQLGRMMAQVAKRMGLRVLTAAESGSDSASGVADEVWSLKPTDVESFRRFAEQCQRLTYESENWPLDLVEQLDRIAPVAPGLEVLRISQNRLREKTFLESIGAPVAAYRPLRDTADAETLGSWSESAILKTTQFGYDGKGQQAVDQAAAAVEVWEAWGRPECVVEQRVDLAFEFSVVGSRDPVGDVVTYGPIFNHHTNHILDYSVLPFELDGALSEQAVLLMQRLLSQLNVIGTVCVEYFVTTQGELLVNEIAPRPHNSGHLTIESHLASQFENHVRAVAGWPLGKTGLRQPAAMVNLLGDLWEHGEPNWRAALETPGLELHLYSKTDARVGRKMGHLTVVHDDPLEALRRALQARARLTGAEVPQPDSRLSQMLAT